jgi:hypothetical protein
MSGGNEYIKKETLSDMIIAHSNMKQTATFPMTITGDVNLLPNSIKTMSLTVIFDNIKSPSCSTSRVYPDPIPSP